MKPVYSFRLDKRLVEEAKKAGFNMAQFIEATLAKAMKEKKCPYCGEYKKHN